MKKLSAICSDLVPATYAPMKDTRGEVEQWLKDNVQDLTRWEIVEVTSNKWWWLSFAEGKSLGVCIAEGKDVQEAATSAHRHGCNPGGQVLGFPLDDLPGMSPEFVKWFETAPRWKLITKREDMPPTARSLKEIRGKV